MEERYVDHVLKLLYDSKKWETGCSTQHPSWLFGDLHLYGVKELNPRTSKVERFELTYRYQYFRKPKVVLTRWVSDKSIRDYIITEASFLSNVDPRFGHRIDVSDADRDRFIDMISVIHLTIEERDYEATEKSLRKKKELQWWP